MRVFTPNLAIYFFTIVLFQCCELFPCEALFMQEVQIGEKHLSFIKIGCGATSPVTKQIVLHEGKLNRNENNGSKVFITSDQNFVPSSNTIILDKSTVVIIEGDSTKTYLRNQKVKDVRFYYIGNDDRILNYPPIDSFVNQHMHKWITTLPVNIPCPAAYLMRSLQGDDDMDVEILIGLNCEDRFRTDHTLHFELGNLAMYNYNTTVDESEIIISFMVD